MQNYNILKFKIWYLAFSLAVLIPGTLFLIRYGLRLAIDFTGGTVITYEMNKTANVSADNIREVFSQHNVPETYITTTKDEKLRFTVRTKPLDVKLNELIKQDLTTKFTSENFIQSSFETIGPSIGAETTKKAFISLGWVMAGILFYIAFAFRNIPKPYSSYKFGLAAIIAMLHDALLVVGFFAIFGQLFGIEVDSLFITALLTVIGFSVHDTIVVFDRIRENLTKLPKNLSFEDVANYSLVETLGRSLATSLTVVITLLSLFILGGESIKIFVLAMLIGIISGTYSSIFTATPILVMWEKKKA